MAKLKIVFRKELWIDINEYYPHFQPALRKQVDNAIYKLLGGQESPAPKQKLSSPSTAGANDTVILKRTLVSCGKVGSKTYALLSEYKPGTEYLKDDIVQKAVNHHGLAKNNVIHNLLRHKYFEVVQ